MRQRVMREGRSSSVPDVLHEWLTPAMLAPLQCVGGRWEELHLRVGRACSVTVGGENRRVALTLRQEDMDGVLMKLCGGSLYAFRESIVKGYLSPGGGVRVGVCGRAALEQGGQQLLGLQAVDTLCIRFPHTLCGVGTGVFSLLRDHFPRGALIYAPPGVGKTTLLRALARHFACGDGALRVALVDSRQELDDGTLSDAFCLSVLSGYPKGLGIEIAARSMNAQLIICDEIGSGEEAQGVLAAANCGVPVIASAHAATLGELLCRPPLRALHDADVFGLYVGIRRKVDSTDYFYDITYHQRDGEGACG